MPLGWGPKLAALVACWVLLACEQAPPDLRPWRPSDHDHAAEPNAGQSVPSNQSAGRDTGMHGIDEVVLAAWKQNCVRCHGVIGRGDGPQGALFRARDLTDPKWQASVTDAQIATVIRSGKGTMPGFQLPDSTVAGLIRLLRLLDAGAAAAANTRRGDAGAPPSEADAAVRAPTKPRAPSPRPPSPPGPSSPPTQSE